MTTCFVCKGETKNNDYTLFSFERTSDGGYTIGVDNADMQGLAVIVCKQCQRDIVTKHIKMLLEGKNDDSPKKSNSKGNGLSRIMMMLGGEE